MNPEKIQRLTRATLGAVIALLLLFASTAHSADCNNNGVDDAIDLSNGTSRDCNTNFVPDECDEADEGIQFNLPLRYDVGRNSVGLTTSDFNNDGYLDFAVAVRQDDPDDPDASRDGVAIVQNLGNLQFEELTFINFSASNPGGPELRPLDLYNVDLNGDGHVDIFCEIRLGTEIAWVFSNGDGSFSEPHFIDLGGERHSYFLFGDIDNDGDTDVISAHQLNDEIVIVENDGNGNLSIGGSIPLSRTGKIVLTDIDKDGNLDLALQVVGTKEVAGGKIQTYRGNGDLTFTLIDEREAPPSNYSSHTNIYLEDVDGDSHLDYIVSHRGEKRIVVHKGNSDFQLADPSSFDTGEAPGRLTFEDVDSDGDLDITATGGAIVHLDPEELTLLINDGEGNFDEKIIFPLGNRKNPNNVIFKDIDNDSDKDLLLQNYTAGTVRVYENKSNSTPEFELAETISVSHGGAIYLLVEDFDLDGDFDFATSSIIAKDSVAVVENVSGGGFTSNCAEFIRGDVNMDGQVSLTDASMLGQFLFTTTYSPPCHDAADATDDDTFTVCDSVTIIKTLIGTSDWAASFPEPHLTPGPDPTGFKPVSEICNDNFESDAPLGCRSAVIHPPSSSNDLIFIGDVLASPGETVLVPIQLTNEIDVEGAQVIFKYNQELLEIDPEDAFSLENTYYQEAGVPHHPGAHIGIHPSEGVATVGIGNLVAPSSVVGGGIEAGSNHILAWLKVKVREDVTEGSVFELTPTNGENDEGVGPYKLKNEVFYPGGARYLSLIPQTDLGIMKIVGDQAFFIRGDSNFDNSVDLSDAVHALSVLFLGEQMICSDATDANDDGTTDISDPLTILRNLFVSNGSVFPQPYPNPGLDPTYDDMTCSRIEVTSRLGK